MKRFIALIIILLISAFALQSAFAAKKASAQKKFAGNFKTKIEFISKSDALITETITINTTKKARVFRELPKFYKSKNGPKALHYDIISFRRNGTSKLVYIRDNVSHITVKYTGSLSFNLGLRSRRETRTYEIVYKMSDAASFINFNLPKNPKGLIITLNNSALADNPENKFGGLVLPFKKNTAVNSYPRPFKRSVWLWAINNTAWIYLTFIFLLLGFHILDVILPKETEFFAENKNAYFKTGLILSFVFLCLYQIRLFPPHNIGLGIITNAVFPAVIALCVFSALYYSAAAVADFIISRCCGFTRIPLLGEQIISAFGFLIIAALVAFTFAQNFIEISNIALFAVYFCAFCIINAMLYHIKAFIKSFMLRKMLASGMIAEIKTD